MRRWGHLRRLSGGAAVALVGALLATTMGAAPAARASTASTEAAARSAVPASTAAARPAELTVGSLRLVRCTLLPGAYCGHLTRAWDPTGAVPGTLSVGFAFVPARDASRPALGTVVPHEGGPGYSTTGTADWYADMYGSLLDRRNLLLADQRGTGMSQPIHCPTLQNLAGAYAPAAARCAARLGDHANLYGSALSADDLAAVVRALGLGRIDLYGDSYGTFFAQVFAGRHPNLLRSVVLDSAYPTYGEDAWYGTQGPALVRAMDLVCARTPGCQADGRSTTTLLRQVLAQVRKAPWHGIGYDAEGVRHRVVVNAVNLIGVTFGGTYGPAFYRELPGALRSALAGNRAALFRLVAEADYVGGGSGPAVDYSEGLDAAVACHDYPQLYDMTAPPSRRTVEFQAAVRAEQRTDPGIYAPFTVRDYLGSWWEEQDWCLTWPVAPAAHPAGPPMPPSGSYPDVPVLVLSSELDSITTAAEGAMIVGQFPRARQVIIANSFHVSTEDDSDGCSSSVLRAFVADPVGGLTPGVLACAPAVPRLRAVSAYGTSYSEVTPATPLRGSAARVPALRAAHAAALAVADVFDRWSNAFGSVGVGLYGGRFSDTGDKVTTFRLKGYRLTRDLAVSGTVVWHRFTHQVTVQLTLTAVDAAGRRVAGSGVDGTLSGHWDTRAADAVASLQGRLGGRALVATVPAP